MEQARMTPGDCPHETKCVDMGKSLKSYCDEMGLWTNCRDLGECTSDGKRHGSKTEDIEEEE